MEDGWLAAENPSHGKEESKKEAVDIDDEAADIDNADVDANQEAMDIDDIDNNKDDDNVNIFATGKYVVQNEPDDTAVQRVRSYEAFDSRSRR